MTQGIKTLYRGAWYRSRLEAKWAAMFDLLGWSAQYEPFDLPGWIPDFSIKAEVDPGFLLVEVKPFLRGEDYATDEMREAIDAAVAGGTLAAAPDVLLLGHSAVIPGPGHADFHSGWLSWGHDQACVNHHGGRYGLIAYCGSYFDRITGLYSGNDYVLPASGDEVCDLWAAAGNLVQWYPAKVVA